MIGTGSDVLDSILSGGLPEGRTTLVTGGPGTGKSTLAMQFLQKGLENGEKALFLSTEQTRDEIEDSFKGFNFDISHDDLAITCIHATKGETLEKGDDELVIKSYDGEELIGGSYSVPFEAKYIKEYLDRFGPVDRVVIDSISGFDVIGESDGIPDGVVLELIRFINDELDATALITSEGTYAGGSDDKYVADAVQFKAHGVVQIWRENVAGDYHRYLEVVKMRGVDHDTRVYEVSFADEGIRVVPRQRSHLGKYTPEGFLSTGVDGLDELMGGGIILGGTSLLQHDGEAGVQQIITESLSQGFEEDMAVVLVPPVELPPSRFDEVFEGKVSTDMDSLLEDDRLFMIDFPNIWENTRRNVYKPAEEEKSIREIYKTIRDRTGDRPVFSLMSVEAMLPTMSNDELRKARFWAEENFFEDEDTSLYIFNPKTIDEGVAEFYKNGAWQVLRTWIDEKGLQYVKLRKSPTGPLGATRIVEFLDEEPYIRVHS